MFRIISIEGNIGSGKSTFMEKLKEHYSSSDLSNKCIIFAEEPVSMWENIKDASGNTMLQKFYEDQERYAFSFQMMAYISRLSILRKIIRENRDKEIVIVTERSLYTDKYVFAKMLRDQGKMEDVNYQIYENWFEEFAGDLPIAYNIYLKAEPTTCYNRIHYRSRAGEEKIPLSYLEDCHRYHNNFIDKFNHVIIDANENVFDEKVLNRWLLQFEEIVNL